MSETIHTPVVISLPIEDRRTSFTFYRDGHDFDPLGEPGEAGIPEPLQFALNDGVRRMLVPTGGFDWVIVDHEVAAHGQSECILDLTAFGRQEWEEPTGRVTGLEAQAGSDDIRYPDEYKGDEGPDSSFVDAESGTES